MSSSRVFNKSLKGGKAIATTGDIQTREEGYVRREAWLGPRIEPSILSPLVRALSSPQSVSGGSVITTQVLRIHVAHGFDRVSARIAAMVGDRTGRLQILLQVVMHKRANHCMDTR